MDLADLLNMARAGHFETPPERPQEQPQTAADGSPPTDALPVDVAAPGGVLTRHWRMDYPDMSPFRVSFVQPWTAAQLLEQATRNRPDLPAPELRPLPPDFMTETMQQISLDLAPSGPETAPEPPATGPTPARVLLEQAGVSVVYVRDLEHAAAVVADLGALPDTGGPWGLDLETTPRPEYRSDSKAGLDPYKATIRTAQVYPGGPECYVFDVAALGLSFLEPLWARAMVAHNAVFELKHLLHAGADPQKLGCTLLMANALRGDRPSLADLAADVLGWTLDKTEQTGDWGGDLTVAQFDYAALDAVTVFKLAGHLGRDLATQERGRCYILMRDAQRAIARLELAGCPFNTAAHADLMATWQATAETARGELDSLLGVNPDSPQQLAGWLKANLPADVLADWPRTAGGSLATDADTLAGLTLPMLEPLARYKGARKLLSTYGTGYVKHIHPETGRLHPSFMLGATATGRLACRTPNIQNPPRDADFRALFAPTPGRVFVVADYSQIELRVAALVSQDPAMLAAYEAGEDLHRKTAAAVLGKTEGEVTKAERQMAKACIAAGSMVLTDRGLVPIEQVTRQDALWDGLSWVSHDGVVYQGYKQVMTYDGLTATPDHTVFIDTGETRLLADAANGGGISLARGESEGFPVRFVGNYQRVCDRTGSDNGRTTAAAVVRTVPVPHDAADAASVPGKPATQPIDGGARGGQGEISEIVSGPSGTGAGSGSRGPLRCHLSAVQQPASRVVPGLWGAGCAAVVRGSGRVHLLGTGEPSSRDLPGGSNRPDRQQRALHTGKPAAGVAANEPTQYPAEPLLHLSGGIGGGFGSLASAEDRLSRLRPIPDADRETGGARCSRLGHPGAETETQYAHVYDILNAGPNHRFTVSGRVVHNCNFGLLFGQGAKGLQRYAKGSYGVDLTKTEANKARSAFFAAYPGLSQWQTRTRKAAERAGQVRTPGGRVRPLDGNRALATESLNTPIQGGAAECLLAALADLEPRLEALGAALVNVVHDEMVVECDPDRVAGVSAAVEAAMTAGFLAIFPDGSTRDLVEAHSGPNWAAAKP